MGHLFKYHLLPDNRKTEDLPSSNLTHLIHVQRCSLISFMFRDVNFCHVWWSLLSNLQWSPSFFRTLWELVAMTFRSGRSASIRTAMAVCSSPRPANWTPSWRNSSSKLAINQAVNRLSKVYVHLFEIWCSNALKMLHQFLQYLKINLACIVNNLLIRFVWYL